ncbi:wax ester/triacylglycerol synthase domain-containing protein [Raineyella fluvialis]|uniref:wax ester/triacylglycerol synthase domain-containing protein n=1 Tax=Raineyella fluvialis TaxID=2662261 RepID=UPI00189074A2|nr:wax ester/triacylglycerol synthase domain-containing protein [Raineyella fluvialis]
MSRSPASAAFAIPRIARLSANDLVSLAEDAGSSVPLQVGLVVMLRTEPGFSAQDVVRALDTRLPSVPRMRQRLVRTAFWQGRSYWADDPDFRLDRHVRVVEARGGREAALAVADELVTTPMPADHPLWAARVVSGLDEGRSAAVVFASHHVMADGVAGMALLRGLTDGPPPTVDPALPAFPRPAPSRWQLLADAVRGLLQSMRSLPATLHDGLRELASLLRARRPLVAASSLTRPTGPHRRSAAVSCDLEAARAAAHAAGASVNDLLLTAIVVALGDLLASRGERAEDFSVGVLVSGRPPILPTHDGHSGSGNRSGTVPITLPATGAPYDRLRLVAQRTAAAKSRRRTAVNAWLGPATRLLAGLGLFAWVARRQRFLHTFASSLRIQGDPLTMAGCPVTEIIPLSVATGNITVVFASVSYAGRLTASIMADAVACPDLDVLRDRLQAALEELLEGAAGPAIPYR